MSYKDVIPESDLRAYEKLYQKVGFGDKPAILVIDVTNAFVDPKYPLASETSYKMSLSAVKNISTLIQKARSRSIPIIYSRSGRGSGLLFDEGVSRKEAEKVKRMGRTTQDPHANQIVDEIAPTSNDLIITKVRASVFFGTPLISYLIYHNIDTLIITGMTTSGCVRASTVDAASYNFRVTIPEECVADRAELPHKVNLFDIDMRYADVVQLSDVMTYLESLPIKHK